jgi:hypothetical protein
MKTFIIFFSVSIFSISCSNKHTENLSETKYAFNENLKLTIDSIVIPLDSISLPEYMSCTSYYENNDSSFLLYAFNPRTRNIDMFDLQKQTVSGHIHLENEGSNGITDVMTLQVISTDSIFIYDGFNFIFINGKGKVLSRTNGHYEKNGYSAFLNHVPFSLPFYNNTDKKIYGRYVTTREPFSYADKELFASYDTQNDSWEVFSAAEYPSYMKNIRTRLGRNTWLSANFTQDRISYNFSALSDIFVFDLNKRRVSSGGGASKLMGNRVKYYSGNEKNNDAKWRHWLDNPNYNPIIYNPYQNIYYRIAFGEFISTPVYTNGGHFHKKIIISVFDNSLRLIYEQILPNYKFNFNGYYSSSKGLLTFGNNPLNPDIDYEKLVLYCISIKE